MTPITLTIHCRHDVVAVVVLATLIESETTFARWCQARLRNGLDTGGATFARIEP